MLKQDLITLITAVQYLPLDVGTSSRLDDITGKLLHDIASDISKSDIFVEFNRIEAENNSGDVEEGSIEHIESSVLTEIRYTLITLGFEMPDEKSTKKSDEKPTKKSDEKSTKKSDEKSTKKSDEKSTKKSDEKVASEKEAPLPIPIPKATKKTAAAAPPPPTAPTTPTAPKPPSKKPTTEKREAKKTATKKGGMI